MDIYFVRHGQTDGNVARRHQHPDTQLNQVGVSEAKAVAAKLSEYNPTHLLSSRQKRALSTAEFISDATGLITETSDDLVEIIRPDYLVGERRSGWRMVMYMSLWYFGYRPASRHDGETYTELRARVKRVRESLATFPPDAKIIVVSHAGFITFFLSHLNYEHALSVVRVLTALCRVFLMRNTQITHLTFIEGKWQIKRK